MSSPPADNAPGRGGFLIHKLLLALASHFFTFFLPAMILTFLRRLPWPAILLFCILLAAAATRGQGLVYAVAADFPGAPAAASEAAPAFVGLQWEAAAAGPGLAVALLPPVPVELAELRAGRRAADAPAVLLHWATTSEIRNAGFDVERRPAGQPGFERVATVPGHGTSHEVHRYAFVDESNTSTAVTYYRLRQLDADGGPGTVSPAIPVAGLPTGQSLPATE